MRDARYAKYCLYLMLGIAAVEYRFPHFHPLTSLDRVLSAISDQTDLMHVLDAAKRAADGR